MSTVTTLAPTSAPAPGTSRRGGTLSLNGTLHASSSSEGQLSTQTPLPLLAEPARSLQECHAIMTAAGAAFELEQKTIFGRRVRTFKNLPASLRDFWVRCQGAWADREYLVLDGERTTYAQTHARALAIANMLATEYNVKQGDKVAIAMRNRPDWVASFWAIQMLGAVVVAVNCWLTLDGLVHCLKISDSVFAIVDQERADQLAPASASSAFSGSHLRRIAVSRATQIPDGMDDFDAAVQRFSEQTKIASIDIQPDDDATIYFTSGTTGNPKAVLSTNRMFLSNLRSSSAATARATLRSGGELPKPPSKSDPARVLLLPVPLFHVIGFTSFVISMTACGGKLVMMRKWSSAQGIKLIREEGVTMTGGVPFIVQEIMERSTPADVVTLKNITFGGAPCQSGIPGLVRRTLAGSTTQQSYGLSESNSVACGHAGDDYVRRPKSVGLPAPATEFKLVRSDGTEVRGGEVGEILLRGGNVFKEYYNDPVATASAFTADGYFRTGDLASQDEEGFVYIHDRAKDIIIRGGENIASSMVEDALFRNPAVQDCAVVGVSDEKLGELPAAVVVVRKSAAGTSSERDIIEHTKQFLPRHCVPVMVVLQMPSDCNPELRIERNPTGKIVKRELKKVIEREWMARQ